MWRCISEKAEQAPGGTRTPDFLCSFMTDKTLWYSVSADLDLKPGPRSFVCRGSIPHTQIRSDLTTQIEIKAISMLTQKPSDLWPASKNQDNFGLHTKTKSISLNTFQPYSFGPHTKTQWNLTPAQKKYISIPTLKPSQLRSRKQKPS